MIITPFEGVNLDVNEIEEIISSASKEFGNKPFSIISNCTAQFSVNPIAYSELSKMQNLQAVAFVRTTHFGRSNFQLEKQFFNQSIQLQLFDSLQKATAWIFELNK